MTERGKRLHVENEEPLSFRKDGDIGKDVADSALKGAVQPSLWYQLLVNMPPPLHRGISESFFRFIQNKLYMGTFNLV